MSLDRLTAICVASGLTSRQASDDIASISTDEIKSQLKRNVEEAVSLGAFGVPFITVGDQVRSMLVSCWNSVDVG